MPEAYDHLWLRIQVCGPVAAESPFDSGTLWGRILHALVTGPSAGRALAERWLSELGEQEKDRKLDWLPPLIISEGFLCDAADEPWLPMPLSVSLRLQREADDKGDLPRKEIKRIERIPLAVFRDVCARPNISAQELIAQWRDNLVPKVTPSLAPHLAINRLTGGGRDGLLFTTAMSVYPASDGQPPEVIFFIKLRQRDQAFDLLHTALGHVCAQGWGHGKARGLGRIKMSSLAVGDPPPTFSDARAFVSLSHFTPASQDPTEGQWKLLPKHPVPAQFINGKRVVLGEAEKDHWRVKSFLRLRAGSCLLLDPANRCANSTAAPSADSSNQRGTMKGTLYPRCFTTR
jgi:hypothetical protein